MHNLDRSTLFRFILIIEALSLVNFHGLFITKETETREFRKAQHAALIYRNAMWA